MASRVFYSQVEPDARLYLRQVFGPHNASMAIVEAADVLAAEGDLGTVGAEIAATEAVDVLAAEATADVGGAIAATEAVDVLAAEATQGVGGAVAWTEAADTLAASSEATVPASMAIVEAADNLDIVAGGEYARYGVFISQEHASGMVFDQQTLIVGLTGARISATEAVDVSYFPACSLWGDGFSVEGADALDVFSGPTGVMDIYERPDLCESAGYAATVLNAVTNWQEFADVHAATADNLYGTTQGYIVLTEAGDVLAIGAEATMPASISLLEGVDAANIATESTSGGAIAVIEAPDGFFLEGPPPDPWTRKEEQVTQWIKGSRGNDLWTRRNKQSTVWTDR